MKLFLIRHGEPDYENDCLTALGRKQAEAICMLKDREQITQVICSPLGRARETALPLTSLLQIKVEIKDWLKEIDDVTVWSRRRVDLAVWNVEPQTLFYWEKKNAAKEQPFAEKMIERWKELTEGVDEVLLSRGIRKEQFGWRIINQNEMKGDIAIFCHLGVGMLLLSYLLDMSPYSIFRSFFLAPASVTSILLEDHGDGTVGFRVLRMGDVSHLVRDNIAVVNSGLQYNKE